MKIKYHFLYSLVICLLFALNIALVFQARAIAKDQYQAIEKTSDFDQYYYMLRRWNSSAIKNNDIKLPPNLNLRGENGETVSLNEIVRLNNGYPKLIIKNSAMSCSICLEEELKHIADYISIIGSDNVMVFASDYNIRSLKTIKKSSTFDFGVYQIEQLGIPFEDDSHNLFAFILDEDFEVKNFFVPEKTLPQLSDNYYEAVCETYFKKRRTKAENVKL